MSRALPTLGEVKVLQVSEKGSDKRGILDEICEGSHHFIQTEKVSLSNTNTIPRVGRAG